jgi:hypothetical protein
MPAATAPAAVESAIAVPRRSGGNSGRARLNAVGSTVAAPSACTTRAATRTGTDGATPLATDAARNSSRPARKSRRRPYRSARRPAGTRAAANTTLYPVSTQDRSASESCGNDCRRSVKAMFTTVTSGRAMKTTAEVTKRTFQRRSVFRLRHRAVDCLMQSTQSTIEK